MHFVTKILLCALGVIGSLFILVTIFDGRQDELMLVEVALSSLLKYLAVLITLTSAFLILGQAVKTKSVGETLPLTVPAIIGLLILSPHWSLGIYLSVLAAGHFTRIILAAKSAPPAQGSRDD